MKKTYERRGDLERTGLSMSSKPRVQKDEEECGQSPGGALMSFPSSEQHEGLHLSPPASPWHLPLLPLLPSLFTFNSYSSPLGEGGACVWVKERESR
jgi:hypothetical protein